MRYADIGSDHEAWARKLRDNDSYINEADFLYANQTALNQRVVVQPQSQFTYKSIYPISNQRDNVETTGTGAVVKSGGEYKLTGGSGTASMATKQEGDYTPGFVMQPTLAVRCPAQPTTGKIEFGYFDSNDGVFCRYDSEGFKFIVRKGGEEVNEQILENDPSKGKIYGFPFLYYGYGFAGIEWSELDSQGVYASRRKHTYYANGGTLFDNPNQPLKISVEGDNEAYVAGRQISLLGSTERMFRIVSGVRREVGSIGTTPLPILSVRIKEAQDFTFAQLSSIAVDTADVLELTIVINATLTGASFGVPEGYDNDEIASEWDSSATALSDGDVIYRAFAGAESQGNRSSVASLDLPQKPIVNGDVYTFALRRVSGVDATASMVARIRENW